MHGSPGTPVPAERHKNARRTFAIVEPTPIDSSPQVRPTPHVDENGAHVGMHIPSSGYACDTCPEHCSPAAQSVSARHHLRQMSAPVATPRSVQTRPAAQSSSPKTVRVHGMPTVSEPLGATQLCTSLPIIIGS